MKCGARYERHSRRSEVGAGVVAGVRLLIFNRRFRRGATDGGGVAS